MMCVLSADTVHTLRQQVATLTAELAAKAESDLDEVLGDLTAHRSHRTHILQGGSLGDDDLELVYSDSETAGLTNRSP